MQKSSDVIGPVFEWEEPAASSFSPWITFIPWRCLEFVCVNIQQSHARTNTSLLYCSTSKNRCPGEDSWTRCDNVLYVLSYCVKRPSLMLWFMLHNMFGKQSKNTWRKWFKAVRSPNRFWSKPTSTWTPQNPLELDFELWPRALVIVAEPVSKPRGSRD